MPAIDVQSHWDPSASLLTSRLSGPVTLDDVQRWKRGLTEAVAAIPAQQSFKLFYDLDGYQPVDVAVHKAMRDVIPLLLARHGMRPAVIDLFDERPEVPVTITDGKRCVAFANLHHDPDKMANYEQRIGRADQRFFSDRDAAMAWLRAH